MHETELPNATESPAVGFPVQRPVRQHSPGPWRFTCHAHDSNYMLITCSNDPGHGDNLRGYCGEANARLVAAAPELLDALRGLRAEVLRLRGNYPLPHNKGHDAMRAADAAIAKAVGSAA